MIGELFSPSEYSYVMNDLKDCTNLEDANVSQLLEPLEVYNGNYESDQSESKYDIKSKKRKLCDSTIPNSGIENLPSTSPFPGQFNFELFLPADSSNTNHRWTYSSSLKKVFIDIDKVLALQFKWNHYEIKSDVQLFVRALPVYTSHDWLKVPVVRCPLHVLPDNSMNTNFAFVDHVIRCEHSNTRYEKNENDKRLSCVTPLSYPQPGSDTTTLTYKFVCKTSCPSGMDRKPISVVFTLEDINGCVYGRQVLAVKICSCPKRDRVKEELNEQHKKKVPKTRHSAPKTGALSIKNNKEASTSAECVANLQWEKTLESNVFTDAAGTVPTIASQISGKSMKIAEKLKKMEDGFSELKKMKDDHSELKNDVRRIRDALDRIEGGDTSSFDMFGRHIAAELKKLPLQAAYEVELEVLKIITMKNFSVYGNVESNSCLTPAPSLVSPDPVTAEEYNEMIPITPTTPKPW